MKTSTSWAVGLALVTLAGAAMAQVTPVRPAYSFPTAPEGQSGRAAVRIGSSPLYATPFVGISAGHDSNLTSAPSNELDSAFQLYSGGVNLDARDANSVFMLRLLGTHANYSDSDSDNYTDWNSRTTYDIALTPRNFVRLGWDYSHGHDPRGSTDRGFSNSPDRYFLSIPGITYSYGAPSAQGRFEVFASRASKRYLNNRESTIVSDRNTKDFGGAFYWRAMPKTSFLVEARGTDLRYLWDRSDLSGSEARYYAGVTWEATAATSGTIKAGRLEKRFDSDRPNYKGTSWEATVTWQPRSYSKFDLYSSRQPIESTGLGNFILSDASGIVWTHGWSSVFTTEANARIQKDKYKGFDRDDDITGFGLKATYKFRRWLTVGAEYQFTNRDSNIGIYEYDKNLWLVSAMMTL